MPPMPSTSLQPARSYPALRTLLILVIVNLVLQPLTEPDFGWHLRTGLDLLQQGRLPDLDPYSHTMPDWAWVEHAWLTDLVMGLWYSAGGALAVILFFGLVTAAAWLLAARTAKAGTVAQLIACGLSLSVALPFLGARTQMMTLLGLAVLLWLLDQGRKRRPGLLWMIPPLFLLWANLHGGFVAGGLYLCLVVSLSWLAKHRPSRAERSRRETWGTLLLVTGLAGLVTLVNPYGWRLHREILASLTDRFMVERLQEWHPISMDALAGKLFLAYLALLGLAMAAWYRRIEPVRWAILAVFLLLAVRHLRNIPVFLIVSLPLFAELLQDGMTRLSATPPWSWLSVSRWAGTLTVAVGLFLWSAGPDHLRHVWRFGVAPAQALRDTSYPIEAVDWIATHRDRLGTRLLHDYQYGGFLLWWLPREKIFIDGRMPAWRLGDRWIFRDYLAVRDEEPPRLEVLDKYAIDWALTKRDSPLARALAALPAWQKVYEDAKVVIYIAKSANQGAYSNSAGEGVSAGSGRSAGSE